MSWWKDVRTSCPNSSKHQEKDLLETHQSHALWWQNNPPRGDRSVSCGHRWFGDTLHIIQDIFTFPLINHRLSPSRYALKISWQLLLMVLGTVWEFSLPELCFFCCRNGSPEISFSTPVLSFRHGTQTMFCPSGAAALPQTHHFLCHCAALFRP